MVLISNVLVCIAISKKTIFLGFVLKMSVEAVKDKLWKKCGTSVEAMALELYDESGSKVAFLSDDTKPLGFFSPFDG